MFHLYKRYTFTSLNSPPSYWRNNVEGTCANGDKCRYAHGSVELKKRFAKEENRN